MTGRTTPTKSAVLVALLTELIDEEYTELAEEVDFVQEGTRSLLEILEAEEEYFDRIWYTRNIARMVEKPDETDAGKKGRERLEKKYGRENLLPEMTGSSASGTASLQPCDGF